MPQRSSRRRHTSRPSPGSGGLEYLSLRFGTIYGPRVAEGSNNATMLDVLRALDAQSSTCRAMGALTLGTGWCTSNDVAVACVRALDSQTRQHGRQRCRRARHRRRRSTPRSCVFTAEILRPSSGGRAGRASRPRIAAGCGNVLGLIDCVPLEEGLQSLIDWYVLDGLTRPAGQEPRCESSRSASARSGRDTDGLDLDEGLEALGSELAADATPLDAAHGSEETGRAAVELDGAGVHPSGDAQPAVSRRS